MNHATLAEFLDRLTLCGDGPRISVALTRLGLWSISVDVLVNGRLLQASRACRSAELRDCRDPDGMLRIVCELAINQLEAECQNARA